ncbi:Ig-like domain-containing protein [Myroides sp. LJL115]
MKTRIIIMLFLSFFIWNCSSDDSSIKEDDKVEDIQGKVVFKTSEKELKLFDTINLLDQINIIGKVDVADIQWSNSNKEVVELEKEELRVIADGEATITVKLKNSPKSSTLRIVTLPISIKVLESTIYVDMSETPTFDLSKLLELKNITMEDLVWSGDFNGHATIEQNGVITFLKNGLTGVQIHVKDKDAIREHISIMVSGGPLDDLWIEQRLPSNEVRINQTYQFHYTVFPEGSDPSGIVWSSSDPNIATVDQNGVVKGISLGIVEITVTAPNGIKGSLQVEIITGDLTHVSITGSTSGVQVINGEEYPLYVSTEPRDADISLLGFSSSDPSVATVDENGLVKTSKGQKGKVYITAFSKKDPSIKDVLEVELVNAFYRVWGNPTFEGTAQGTVLTGKLQYGILVYGVDKATISDFKIYDKYGKIVFQDDRENIVIQAQSINYEYQADGVDSPYVTYTLKYKDHQENRKESFNI